MWLLILILYILFVGFTYNLILRIQKKKKRTTYDESAEFESAVMAVFWPAALLILAGDKLANKLFKP